MRLSRIAQEMEVKSMTAEDAYQLGVGLGVDWDSVEFAGEDLLAGMQVELEHGTKSEETNVTDDDPLKTAQIALVHLYENPEYYVLLKEHVEG